MKQVGYSRYANDPYQTLFSKFFAVDFNGNQGGLAPLWNQMEHYTASFITAEVHLHTIPIQCLFTDLYREPRVDKCLQFWSFFKIVQNTQTIPWIIIGNYNRILSPMDKSGGEGECFSEPKFIVKTFSLISN